MNPDSIFTLIVKILISNFGLERNTSIVNNLYTHIEELPKLANKSRENLITALSVTICAGIGGAMTLPGGSLAIIGAAAGAGAGLFAPYWYNKKRKKKLQIKMEKYSNYIPIEEKKENSILFLISLLIVTMSYGSASFKKNKNPLKKIRKTLWSIVKNNSFSENIKKYDSPTNKRLTEMFGSYIDLGSQEGKINMFWITTFSIYFDKLELKTEKADCFFAILNSAVALAQKIFNNVNLESTDTAGPPIDPTPATPRKTSQLTASLAPSGRSDSGYSGSFSEGSLRHRRAMFHWRESRSNSSVSSSSGQVKTSNATSPCFFKVADTTTGSPVLRNCKIAFHASF